MKRITIIAVALATLFSTDALAQRVGGGPADLGGRRVERRIEQRADARQERVDFGRHARGRAVDERRHASGHGAALEGTFGVRGRSFGRWGRFGGGARVLGHRAIGGARNPFGPRLRDARDGRSGRLAPHDFGGRRGSGRTERPGLRGPRPEVDGRRGGAAGERGRGAKAQAGSRRV
ncbi:MAG: hypothetical protein R3F34_01120 [Planctomycetota bacterium]